MKVSRGTQYRATAKESFNLDMKYGQRRYLQNSELKIYMSAFSNGLGLNNMVEERSTDGGERRSEGKANQKVKGNG